MSKKILFFIVLFNLIEVNNIVSSEIIPLKKPLQTKEETAKKLLIDVIKPLPKPVKKNETQTVVKEADIKQKRNQQYS